MKQILQHPRSGQTEVADVPAPLVRPGHLLIQTTRSLISAGTERMVVDTSRASLIGKAMKQPQRVMEVWKKLKTDGWNATYSAVMSKLDEPIALGYCNVGRVIEVGPDVYGYQVGDRVASNGSHAEIVCVPTTLCAKIPDDVSDENASFAVAGAISLQGVRLLEPTFGERFVVLGLGLLGQLAVQFLRGSGCHVLGLDLQASRCELAERFGAQTLCTSDGADAERAAEAFSRGNGVDGVLITASAKSDAIMEQCAKMCRRRGRIVLVGDVPLNLKRADFYAKELKFQVSCSYGPGRHDPMYEEGAQDYPLPFVRWTEGRNIEAVLDAQAAGTLDVEPLISRRVALANAGTAYDALLSDGNMIGAVLSYPDQPPPIRRSISVRRGVHAAPKPTAPKIAVIGAGNFTKGTVLPSVRAAGGDILAVVSAGGVSSIVPSRKVDALEASTDYREVLARPEINTVFITTRHSSHPKLAAEALAAGKHVFVEKPLAIDRAGLELVRDAVAANPNQHFMVGFNRRFSPHSVTLKRALEHRAQPLTLNIQMNAGHLPADHWTQDPRSGGGRIIGEACHLIDLALYYVGHPITNVYATMVGPQAGKLREDKMTIVLNFADGSIATIHYWANGGKSYPKERVEVFSEGRVALIDNWQSLKSYDWKNGPNLRTQQDKGHRAEITQFLQFLDSVKRGGAPLIPFDELELVTVVSFAAVESARDGNPRQVRLVN
ncbi:MAG: bi-domain-containing oxidoreductase [Phycisphaerae bacterium]|nr:bi-domain-containing oxidoreductase [Phycisphaerae bacterium]